MNNLNIGLVVNALLKANEALTTKVGTNIFPLVAQHDPKFPFITYQRRAVTPYYVKDGIASEEVSVEIYVAATSYTESIDIANLVRESLELKSGTIAGTRVRMLHLTGAQETFYNGIYIQQLTFNIVI